MHAVGRSAEVQTRVWKRGDAGRGGEESQNEKEKLSGVTLYDYL